MQRNECTTPVRCLQCDLDAAESTWPSKHTGKARQMNEDILRLRLVQTPPQEPV